MTRMRRTAVFLGFVLAAHAAAAQTATPNLSRQQKTALQTLVDAVNAAAADPDTPNLEWPLHVFRASDGSHYVAFSVFNPPGFPPNQARVVYVRLSTRRDLQTIAHGERSLVAEWLAGQRSTPIRPERGLAFGDMPTFGAGSAAAAGRDPAASTRGVASQNLQLLELARERARERREAAERERRATLEGAAPAVNEFLPFEDFDVRAVAESLPDGSAVLRRSLTAGPGDYTLTIAWHDPSARGPQAVRLVKRSLELPAASSNDFALSGVIIADEVGVRDVPLGPDQQSANPYSIGTMTIRPARDHTLSSAERLAVLLQVINARPGTDGKPDVAVGFQVFRQGDAGETSIGTLSPQLYTRDTMPADFDLAKGHPIFVAVGVPLGTFKRGSYRLLVRSEDRHASATASTDVRFVVSGTVDTLLAEAPSLIPAFRRDALLEPSIVAAMVDGLRPMAPSVALANALASARAGKFIELVRDQPVAPDEQPQRSVLFALALYALGDTPTAISAALAPALAVPTPPAAAHVVTGAFRALAGNHRDALAAWTAAAADPRLATPLTPLIVEEQLRAGSADAAAATAMRQLGEGNPPGTLVHRLAAAYILSRREGDAVALLDRHLQANPDDGDGQWLRLHALFSQIARATGATATDATRFHELARTYIDAGGTHAALAREWQAVASR